jgi:hypothetical protein
VAPRIAAGPSSTALLVLLALALLPLTGCSLFRSEASRGPEVTAPEPRPPDTPTKVAPKKVDRATTTKPSTSKGAGTAGPPADTLGAAEVVPPTPAADPPQVTVQLSAEQRSVREMAYRDDSGRAARALDGVRTKVLSAAQRDQLGSADRFLVDAVAAFQANDLVRACVLAEKARYLAEELKMAVAP